MNASHGITEKQWLAYIEGLLPESEHAKVQAHLEKCVECQQICRGIRDWEDVVRAEARLLITALDRAPQDVDRLTERILNEIRSIEPGQLGGSECRFDRGVLLLRALMDPLCGRGAAQSAIRLATEQSCAGEQSLRESNWALFVRNLGAAIGGVYGVPVRTLIERVGYLVGAEVH
jgi:anti-sigma factor RsiW